MIITNPKDLTWSKILDLMPQEVIEHLEGLKTLVERPDFHCHPEEKCCYDHIRIVTERLIPLGDLDLIFAGVFHDIGKLVTNVGNEKTGWPSAPEHDRYGAKMVEKYAGDLYMLGANPKAVRYIVRFHMMINNYHNLNKRKWAYQEIASSEYFDKLLWFNRADDMTKPFIYKLP